MGVGVVVMIGWMVGGEPPAAYIPNCAFGRFGEIAGKTAAKRGHTRNRLANKDQYANGAELAVERAGPRPDDRCKR